MEIPDQADWAFGMWRWMVYLDLLDVKRHDLKYKPSIVFRFEEYDLEGDMRIYMFQKLNG